MPTSVPIGFAAGATGAVANVLFLTTIALIGLPSLTDPGNFPVYKAFLYKQMVWGGFWGILMALVFVPKNWILRGVVFGLAAAMAVFFIFLPMKGAGIAGLEKGMHVPLLVLGADLTWGLVTSWTLQYFLGKK